MSEFFKKRRQAHRYRATVRQLRSLPPDELQALGIPASQIDRLACAAARAW